MPVNVSVSALSKAPKEVVWQVLADFPNIADYTDSVKTSISTSEHAIGIGASRRCDLAPAGSSEEEIVGFSPGDRLVVSLQKARGMPVKSAETTFSLTEVDPETTKLTMSMKVEAKGGILSGIVAKILQRRLPKVATRLVEDFAASSERIASARS